MGARQGLFSTINQEFITNCLAEANERKNRQKGKKLPLSNKRRYVHDMARDYSAVIYFSDRYDTD
jgi:hypothetical protein